MIIKIKIIINSNWYSFIHLFIYFQYLFIYYLIYSAIVKGITRENKILRKTLSQVCFLLFCRSWQISDSIKVEILIYSMLPTVIMKPIKIPLVFHSFTSYLCTPATFSLFTRSKKRSHTKKRNNLLDKEPSRSFIKMFLCHVDHLISDAEKENSRTTGVHLHYVYTFHQVSEVDTTALWLPIRGKCPEIYRVIVTDVIEYELLCLAPSRWPVGKKDWLDASNKSIPLSTDFYLRINWTLFLSADETRVC